MTDLEYRRRVMMQKIGGGDLPAGYTKVDWVGCTRLLTSHYAHDNMSVKIKYSVNTSSKWVSAYAFGLYTNSATNVKWYCGWNGNAMSVTNGNVALRTTGETAGLGVPMDCNISMGQTRTTYDVTVNGKTKTATQAETARPDFTKFAISLNSSGQNYMKFWKVEFYGDTDYGTLEFAMIPCIEDSTGMAGFYDTSLDTFVGNVNWTYGYDN